MSPRGGAPRLRQEPRRPLPSAPPAPASPPRNQPPGAVYAASASNCANVCAILVARGENSVYRHWLGANGGLQAWYGTRRWRARRRGSTRPSQQRSDGGGWSRGSWRPISFLVARRLVLVSARRRVVPQPRRRRRAQRARHLRPPRVVARCRATPSLPRQLVPRANISVDARHTTPFDARAAGVAWCRRQVRCRRSNRAGARLTRRRGRARGQPPGPSARASRNRSRAPRSVRTEAESRRLLREQCDRRQLRGW